MPEQDPTSPSKPVGLYVVPGLIVLAVLVQAVRMGSGPTTSLGNIALLYLGMIPGGLCFLCMYGFVVSQLRARRPHWPTVLVVLLASLSGVAFCALGVALLLGAYAIEHALE